MSLHVRHTTLTRRGRVAGSALDETINICFPGMGGLARIFHTET